MARDPIISLSCRLKLVSLVEFETKRELQKALSSEIALIRLTNNLVISNSLKNKLIKTYSCNFRKKRIYR